jgi:hypothetical protein
LGFTEEQSIVCFKERPEAHLVFSLGKETIVPDSPLITFLAELGLSTEDLVEYSNVENLLFYAL